MSDAPLRPMDRPRDHPGSARGRALRSWARTGAVLVGVVAAVSLLPVGVLWWVQRGWEEDVAARAPGAPGGGVGEIVTETVTFRSGDATLAGTVVLPSSPGPHPGIVVVHGSGRRYARGYVPDARDLAAEGFAVLVYDKRGVGDSGGTYTGVWPENSEAVLGQLAEDALAGLETLAARQDVRDDAVGLLGISQGGWIAPLAASRSAGVAFLVLRSGPAVSVGEEVHYSDLTGDDRGQPTGLPDEVLSARLAAFDGERGFDPRPVLRRLGTPSLWLLGARDRSIPVAETVAELEALRREGRDVTIRVVEGADHGLRDVRSGLRADVVRIESEWIRQVLP